MQRIASCGITFCIGVFIGIANAVPGVSGGTIAVICNEYDSLLLIASCNIKTIRAARQKVWCLGLGMLAGIVGFSKVITFLYAAYPNQVHYFFIGIIIGSLSFLYDTVKKALQEKDTYPSKRDSATAFAYGIVGLVLMAGIYYAQQHGIYAPPLQATYSFAVILQLFCFGAIAAFAMLIPGISGSFMLLVLGAYHTIIQAVASFNIPLLLPTGVGVCSGLLLGARFIRFLLKQFPAAVYSAIIGLTLGSILFLLPRTCEPFTMRLISAALLATGYGIVSFFQKQARALNT
ncbi:MAG: DUF368 domain-containing protein [Treponema sp.]